MAKIYADKIKLVHVDAIKLNPKNRNHHPEAQVLRLASIIKDTGFRRPCTVSNRTGLLVCGEGRYLAAKRLGLTEIPVMFQDYDSAEQEFADSIADNAIDKWSLLDTEGIIEDVKLFGDLDEDLLGLKDPLESDFSPGTEEDQGNLDQKSFKFYLCPHCDERFEIGQATPVKD